MNAGTLKKLRTVNFVEHMMSKKAACVTSGSQERTEVAKPKGSARSSKKATSKLVAAVQKVDLSKLKLFTEAIA